VDVELRPEDIDFTACRSSGPGGQNVNKVSSAVRLVHKPTGVVVECQTERSQSRNRDQAMRRLRALLYERAATEKKNERDNARRSQIGTGDRSEKIRTYNFPQNRVTDHRINFSLHNLPAVMLGQIDDMVAKLGEVDYQEKVKALASAS
jgi:peptide chain release factor 1